jgi:hypothetical protein
MSVLPLITISNLPSGFPSGLITIYCGKKAEKRYQTTREKK